MEMSKFLIAGPIVAGLLLLTSAGAASAQQPQCDERDRVLELLAKKYKESPAAAGVTNTGGLVEVLTDRKGGSWTIIVSTPEGVSCLIAAGEGWRSMPKREPEGPEA